MQWCQRLDADYGVDPCIWQSLHGPSFHLSSKHWFFLKQFTQAASLFKSPVFQGTSVFIHSSHNHASTNHHRSHHLTRQACSANQGLRASHPPNMGLFTAWHRFPSRLARESGMASHNSPFYILLKQAPWVKIEV